MTVLPTSDPRIVARVDGAVGTLVIANEAKKNAVSLSMWNAIPPAVAALEAVDDVRVIVVRGEGGVFVSGADISEFAEVRKDAASARAYEASNAAAFAAIRQAGKPTVAAIRGFCLGGGMGMAVACDLRVAAADAVFGIPAGRLGVGYPSDCMRDVVNAVGPARAKELFFTARRLKAEEALSIGLVARIVPVDGFDAEIAALATTIAANAPLTLRAAKAAVNAVIGDADAVTWERVRALTDACFASEDFKEGRTAFLEKREPTFRGR